MKAGGLIACGLGAVFLAGTAAAQTWRDAPVRDGPEYGLAAHDAPGAWRVDPSHVQFSEGVAFEADMAVPFGGAFRAPDLAPRSLAPRIEGHGYAVTETWRDTASGAVERLRLSRGGGWLRADGAPAPLIPSDPAYLDADHYDVTYARGWPARGFDTASGLELELTPHAGVGLGSDGGSAEAGATLRIGSGLSRLAPEGQDVFDDDQVRWYVFAAGSRRAVGYNFARTRDGDFVRSGMSHDSGAFIGDAQVGIAWRRGDVQTSFGYVYRKHKVRELVGRDFERERSEGLVAFQLSIRPDW